MTEQDVEQGLNGLVSYHLDGRMQLFSGLMTHDEMNGAIIALDAVLGGGKVTAIEDRLVLDTGHKWKYQTIAEANKEFCRSDHHCYYCDMYNKIVKSNN